MSETPPAPDARPLAELTARELREIVGEAVREAVGAGPPDELLTIEKVARLCGVTQRTLRRWMRDGIFPDGERVGGSRRWPRSLVNDWMGRLARRLADAHDRKGGPPDAK